MSVQSMTVLDFMKDPNQILLKMEKYTGDAVSVISLIVLLCDSPLNKMLL